MHIGLCRIWCLERIWHVFNLFSLPRQCLPKLLPQQPGLSFLGLEHCLGEGLRRKQTRFLSGWQSQSCYGRRDPKPTYFSQCPSYMLQTRLTEFRLHSCGLCGPCSSHQQPDSTVSSSFSHNLVQSWQPYPPRAWVPCATIPSLGQNQLTIGIAESHELGMYAWCGEGAGRSTPTTDSPLHKFIQEALLSSVYSCGRNNYPHSQVESKSFTLHLSSLPAMCSLQEVPEPASIRAFPHTPAPTLANTLPLPQAPVPSHHYPPFLPSGAPGLRRLPCSGRVPQFWPQTALVKAVSKICSVTCSQC